MLSSISGSRTVSPPSVISNAASCALATMDENPKAAAQWNDWRDVMLPAVAQHFNKHLQGGGWPEGFGYGPLAIINICLPIWATGTATGRGVRSGRPCGGR